MQCKGQISNYFHKPSFFGATYTFPIQSRALNGRIRTKFESRLSGRERKGQISLDLIVALLAFLVMVQVVLNITGSLESSQEAISLQNQERAIAETVAGKLSQIPILSTDASSSEFTFQTPYLLMAGKPKQDCEITQASGKIKVNYSNNTAADALDDIAVEVPFEDLGISYFSNSKLSCGSTIKCSNNSSGVWSCV